VSVLAVGVKHMAKMGTHFIKEVSARLQAPSCNCTVPLLRQMFPSTAWIGKEQHMWLLYTAVLAIKCRERVYESLLNQQVSMLQEHRSGKVHRFSQCLQPHSRLRVPELAAMLFC